MIHVRLASLDDVLDIVKVYCSSVSKWVRRIGEKEIEVRYEDLTIDERWSHGGPWMSVETCAIHINYLLTYGQYPLVAELNGSVVGELELYIGEELGILGRTAFIDVLEVHNNFRRMGVGKALISRAREIAEEHECNTLSVWPLREAVDFYRKCGLVHTVYTIVNLEVGLDKLPGAGLLQAEVQEFPGKYSLLKDTVFVAPRILSSFAAWIKSRWKYATEVEKVVSIECCLPGRSACYILESVWGDRSKGRAALWVKDTDTIPEVINTLVPIASSLKFRKLILMVDEILYRRYLMRYPHKIISKEVVLAQKLK